jgi:hypothetical protein
MERHSGASRQLVSSSGVASRGHYPGLLAAVVPRAGEDLLHWLVSNRSPVILALDRDALALVLTTMSAPWSPAPPSIVTLCPIA